MSFKEQFIYLTSKSKKKSTNKIFKKYNFKRKQLLFNRMNTV